MIFLCLILLILKEIDVKRKLARNLPFNVSVNFVLGLKGRKPEKLIRENGISSIRALQIAFEDPSIIFFIKTCFSSPEERPTIITHKYLSPSQTGFKWRVEIIEKNSFLTAKKELINLALVEIDSTRGKVIKRCFFRSILWPEYLKIRKVLS